MDMVMEWRFVRAAVAALLVASCAGSDGTSVAVGANELGIAHLEIEHSSADGERLLVLRGLDGSGEEIALATLRTGMVAYTPEPGVMPEEWSKGTELTVTVGAVQHAAGDAGARAV